MGLQVVDSPDLREEPAKPEALSATRMVHVPFLLLMKGLVCSKGRMTRGRMTRGRVTRGRMTRGRMTRGRVTRGRMTRGRIDEMVGTIAVKPAMRGCMSFVFLTCHRNPRWLQASMQCVWGNRSDVGT